MPGRKAIYSMSKARHKRVISRFGTVHAKLERLNAGPSRTQARGIGTTEYALNA